MACCPFHHDKTPSMKLDRRYHCFGCGADGDEIDFAAALYGLGKKEACLLYTSPGTLEYQRTGSTRRYHPGYECKWATNTVVHILENRE